MRPPTMIWHMIEANLVLYRETGPERCLPWLDRQAVSWHCTDVERQGAWLAAFLIKAGRPAEGGQS
jgi:hypothetical protein